jgi:hypothetical protein
MSARPSSLVVHARDGEPLAAIPDAIVEAVSRLSQEDDVSENERKHMDLETSYAALDREAIKDVDRQREAVEAALWAAVRALLERKESAQEALAQAELIRTALLERNGDEDG